MYMYSNQTNLDLFMYLHNLFILPSFVHNQKVQKSCAALPTCWKKHLVYRFQAKGMDIGVTDDSLNGIPYEESSTSSDEEEEVEGEEGEADRDLIRSSRKQRERPLSFSKMGDIKCRSVLYCKVVFHGWCYMYWIWSCSRTPQTVRHHRFCFIPFSLTNGSD